MTDDSKKKPAADINPFLAYLMGQHKSMKEGKEYELVDLEILEDTTDDEGVTGDSKES